MQYKIVEREIIVKQTWVVGIDGDASQAIQKVIDEDMDATHLQGADAIAWDREDEFVTTILDPTEKELADPVIIKAIRGIEAPYECQEETPKKRRKSRKSGLTKPVKSGTLERCEILSKIKEN